MNPLLSGHNSDSHIVAAHPADEKNMRVYFRDIQGIRFEDVPFYPFFHLSDSRLIEGFTRKHWAKELGGNAFYKYLCAFEEWPAMWDGLRHVLESYNATASAKTDSLTQLEVVHILTDPATQYLLQSGRTLFKGMAFDDLHRLQLDIETYNTPSSQFSDSRRSSDRIILIALSDNRGWEHLIDGSGTTEKEMLLELFRILKEKDPDVIEGHNILGFDLPYILKRCKNLGAIPAFGRDGSAPRSFDSRFSVAERSIPYTGVEIAGRHIVDTLMLVQSYDMIKRNMESYGLKYAAKYFGIAPANRTYISGNRISWHWDNDRKTLMDYAMDDVRETRALSERLSGSSFYLTQMLPLNYGAVIRSGSASKIELLMTREYVRSKESMPKPGEGIQTSGGYTDVFLRGVLEPIIHADVESLYPSIMITEAIKPASDVLDVFPQILKELTQLRLDTKRHMKLAGDATERNRLDAMQSSFKILINSFYGYLGYRKGLFNDHVRADQVTSTGQDLLRSMMRTIQTLGGTVVEVDTDGIFFIPPRGETSREVDERFVQQLSDSMPAGISVALDGRYRKMLSYRMKNYALLGYDEHLTIKGSALISRSMERFGRSYIKQCITCLLDGDLDGLHNTYLHFHHVIIEGSIDILDLAKTETLNEGLHEYLQAVESGKRNRSAAYEVAIGMGGVVKQGMKVSYYISGNDPNPKSFESCKSVDEWNPSFPDQNKAYYLKRLNEFSEKFMDFFKPQDYRSIFSPDDLFPFESHGVRILTTTVTSASSLSQGIPSEE